MNKRKQIDEKISFPIGKTLMYRTPYFCTWEELIKTEGILPTDIVLTLFWHETEQPSLGYGNEPEDNTCYTPSIIIIRKREETDVEFEKRMIEESKKQEELEKQEFLEYLRLKAKYENKNK